MDEEVIGKGFTFHNPLTFACGYQTICPSFLSSSGDDFSNPGLQIKIGFEKIWKGNVWTTHKKSSDFEI